MIDVPAATAASRAAATGAGRRAGRRTIRGWLAARTLRLLSGVLRRLPDRPLHRAAHLGGGLLYRLQPARRRLVRENLGRVVRYLAEHGMATGPAAAAARDERALERLVRDAFGHYVRGYLEGAILPAYGSLERLERVQPDDPALEQAFGPASAGARIVVGLHFGAIEIPGLWASRRLGLRITSPMETIADPDLQAYLEESRGASDLNLIPVAGAAAELRRTLARGDTVALVADRPVGGAGTPVQLFGSAARLPVGPAVLALESGVPVWLVATRRAGWGDYRARIERIEVPSDGTRRERLAGFLHAQARAFERAIADAPEQWWTLFFPIWAP